MPKVEFDGFIPQEVMDKINSGELKIHGLQIRHGLKKHVTHIVAGLEHVTTNNDGLPNHTQIDALRSAISAQQILGMVAIAQNAALATTIERMETKLDAINDRLANMESQLRSIGTEVSMTRAAIFQAPVAKFSAAKSAMGQALRHNDISSLIAATKDIHEAALLLLGQAQILVHQRMNSVPVFLFGRSAELGELVAGAADALLVATDLHMKMKAPAIALDILEDFNTRITKIMHEIAKALLNEDSLAYRAGADLDTDEAIVRLGELMTKTLHTTTGRTWVIKIAEKSDDACAVDLPTEHNFISFIPVSQDRAI